MQKLNKNIILLSIVLIVTMININSIYAAENTNMSYTSNVDVKNVNTHTSKDVDSESVKNTITEPDKDLEHSNNDVDNIHSTITTISSAKKDEKSNDKNFNNYFNDTNDDLNLKDDSSKSDNIEENLLSSSRDSNILKSHISKTVDNWEDLKKCAEDTDNRYTIKLKENTVFVPTSQIVCNQKISIIGNKGVVIGSTDGTSISISPFVFNANGITIKDIDFKYISSRVIYIKGDASITNCSFDHIGGNSIYLDGGHINVYDCNFTNGNQAIIVYGNENVGPYYSYMNIYNSNFINLKTKKDDYAGAIRNSGQLLLVNCTFNNNKADTWGGCIASNPTTNITIYNSTFENNVAGWNGGAISTYSYLQVYNTIFRGNKCTTNYGGGAIFALSYGSDAHLWIVNSTFEKNINTCFNTDDLSTDFLGKGGAISIGDSSTLNVYNSTFISNLAANGLAICSSSYEDYGDPATVIGGNTFINHTGESETLMGKATVYGNTFINSNVHYNLKSTYSTFYLGQSSLINVNLENPNYYDSDLLSRTNFTLFITNPNGNVNTVKIKGDRTYKFTPTLAGRYIIYAESPSFSSRSGNLTIIVTNLESPTINDDNIEDYFENTNSWNNGYYIYKLKDNLNVYKDTIFIGSLTNKNLIFNQKLNVIGKEDNCLTNCTITLSPKASGSTINGLNIKAHTLNKPDYSYSYITLEKGIKDINLVNNNININSPTSRLNNAIELNTENNDVISNINITNNIITINSNADNVYGIYASSNKAESLNKINIVGNNISIKGSDSVEAIYLYRISDSIVNDNIIRTFANSDEEIVNSYGINAERVNGVNINNNTINATSSKATYGITLSESNEVNVLDNEIYADAISAIGLGLSGSSTNDINLINNCLVVNAGDYSSITTDDPNFGTGANSIVVTGGASANIYNNSLGGNASSMDTSNAGNINNSPTLTLTNTRLTITNTTNSITIKLTTKDTNTPIANAKIKYNITNQTPNQEATTLTDGTFTISNLEGKGDITITATYEGDDTYNKTTNTATYNFPTVTPTPVKVNPKFNIVINNVEEGNPILVKVNAVNTFNANVEVKITGNTNKTVQVTLTNGTGSASVSDLTNGQYSASIKFLGDESFNAENKTILFNITKKVEPITPENKTETNTTQPENKTGDNTPSNQDQGQQQTTGTQPSTQQETTKKQDQSENSIPAKQIQITPKIAKTVSKKAKKLSITVQLKVKGKIAKKKTVIIIIKGKKYTKKTTNKGVAKLTLNKKQLSQILKKVKPGKKIKVQIRYGKKTITKYIKIKK